MSSAARFLGSSCFYEDLVSSWVTRVRRFTKAFVFQYEICNIKLFANGSNFQSCILINFVDILITASLRTLSISGSVSRPRLALDCFPNNEWLDSSSAENSCLKRFLASIVGFGEITLIDASTEDSILTPDPSKSSMFCIYL